MTSNPNTMPNQDQTNMSQEDTSSDFENLSIKELWKLVENWYREYCPDAYNSLGPPIRTEELQELETKLGVKLPADYKESLLLHNGTIGEYFPFLETHHCICHKEVISEWECMVSLSKQFENDDLDFTSDLPEFRDVYWSSKWIPFAVDGDGQSYFIDLDPTSVGNVGQLGSFDNELGIERLLGKSFQEFFSNYVRDIYCGKYSIDEEGFFWPTKQSHFELKHSWT
ncbi:unnamed protein product [Ambrosiozyma monospora]|uniref:Unnamed protein product n=1 Tax=Ambrosiozyma monospora TaxID=43982 RepID=A0A9W6YZZ0_AMBMO|nr:unnamed protein product [Ambrosiozyma monospora]